MPAGRSQGSAVSTNLQCLVEVLLRFRSLSFGLRNAWRQIPERRLHMANRRVGYAAPVGRRRRRRCALRRCGRSRLSIILSQSQTVKTEQRESCKSGNEYRLGRQHGFAPFSLLSIHGLLLQDPPNEKLGRWERRATGPGLRPELNRGGRTDSSVAQRMWKGSGTDPRHDCPGGRKSHFLRPTISIDLASFCSSEIASFWSGLRQPHSFVEGTSRHEI